jgi:hypothetical protein
MVYQNCWLQCELYLQVLRDMERQRLIYIVLASGDPTTDKAKVHTLGDQWTAQAIGFAGSGVVRSWHGDLWTATGYSWPVHGKPAPMLLRD